MPGSHLTIHQAAMWRTGKLPEGDIPGIAAHLAGCEACQRLAAPVDAESRLTAAVENGEQLHLTYKQMELLANSSAGEEARLSAESHLALCDVCADELADLRQFAITLKPQRKPGLRWVWAAGGSVAVAAALLLVVQASKPRETKPAEVAATQDSGRKVWLDGSGALHGIEGVPEDLRTEMIVALREGVLPAGPASELNGRRDTLLGTVNSVPVLHDFEPAGTAVAGMSPSFRWDAKKTASRFVVKVYTRDFEPVLTSPELSEPEWTASGRLMAGATEVWTVTAVVDGNQVTAPAAPEPEARFRIATDNERAQLDAAKALHSDLAVAVAATRLGMYGEARSALQRLGPGETTTRLLAELATRTKN